MAGVVAIVVLGLVVLALVAFIAWREREHRSQLSEFADRVMAPEAAQMAAFRLPEPGGAEPPEDQYTERIERSDGLPTSLDIDDLMGAS